MTNTIKEGSIITSEQLARDYGCFKKNKSNKKFLAPITVFLKTGLSKEILWLKDKFGEICPLSRVEDAELVK